MFPKINYEELFQHNFQFYEMFPQNSSHFLPKFSQLSTNYFLYPVISKNCKEFLRRYFQIYKIFHKIPPIFCSNSLNFQKRTYFYAQIFPKIKRIIKNFSPKFLLFSVQNHPIFN